MRYTFVSAVPAMLGAVAWGAWDAYVSTQRAAAERPRTPPALVRPHADAPAVAADGGDRDVRVDYRPVRRR
jgi:hypothetical protein